MKAIIFNGALERRPQSTSGILSKYFTDQLEMLGVSYEMFALADSGIPLYDISLTKVPLAVERMAQLFLDGAHVPRKYSGGDEKLSGLAGSDRRSGSTISYRQNRGIGVLGRWLAGDAGD